MSIGYYVCNYCGETFPDVVDFELCDCGKVWCSAECAENDGHTEEYDSENGEVHKCDYCRKEKFTPEEVMRGLMDAFNLNDDDVLRIMKAR